MPFFSSSSFCLSIPLPFATSSGVSDWNSGLSFRALTASGVRTPPCLPISCWTAPCCSGERLFITRPMSAGWAPPGACTAPGVWTAAGAPVGAVPPPVAPDGPPAASWAVAVQANPTRIMRETNRT
ncbi:MAG: hypothetical protein A4E60_02217 [Syntrophorhabdus sp. PtaB.Bin047]|nr:MAG: hypothetical protein A4E60_02217 [Syntrophorhabdus sp. PtaB.Bin047]